MKFSNVWFFINRRHLDIRSKAQAEHWRSTRRDTERRRRSAAAYVKVCCIALIEAGKLEGKAMYKTARKQFAQIIFLISYDVRSVCLSGKEVVEKEKRMHELSPDAGCVAS